MTLRPRVAALLSLLWRAAVLALLVWNALEVREARRAADEAGAAAHQAIQAVDELAGLIDEALSDETDEEPAEHGT
jgi:cytochrome c-type biogenesis protein CcmH/NrfF